MKVVVQFIGWTKFWYSLIWLAANCGSVLGATPDHVLASVRTLNGGTCSGTIISKGDEWAAGISCAHCFRGIVGGKFWVYYPDGSTAQATLVAHDPKRDLALFRVPAKTVLAVAQLPNQEPSGSFDVTFCGYPGGNGPMYHRASSQKSTVTLADGMWRWTFPVEGEARVFGGNSGCGVFANGQTVGVLSHRNTEGVEGKVLYCAPYPALVSFLNENTEKCRDCNGWFCPIDRSPRGGAVPPPDAPPSWTPRPNIPIERPYDGRGPRPPNLDSDKDMAREIDLLKGQIIDLQSAIDALKRNSGNPGEQPPAIPGPKGDAGPPGLSATDEQVQAAVDKWLGANIDSIKGRDGMNGKDGRAGVVSVEIFWKDGEKIATIPDLTSGTKVGLPLIKVPPSK